MAIQDAGRCEQPSKCTAYETGREDVLACQMEKSEIRSGQVCPTMKGSENDILLPI